MTHPSQESERRIEPLTAEEERSLRGQWAVFAEAITPDHPTGVVPRLLATLDAAREQAATEVRRELLAKVEGLESWDFGSTGGEFYVRLDDVVTLLGGTVRD